MMFFFKDHKIFNSYTYQINIFSSKKDITTFQNYEFVILNYLKKELGDKYEFKNYKITGPNFTSIYHGQQKIKNEKKTDYIKLNNFIYIKIVTQNIENISIIKKIILNQYPLVMNYARNLDIFNITNDIYERLEILCVKNIFKYEIDKSVCDQLLEKPRIFLKFLDDQIDYLDIKDLKSFQNQENIKSEFTKFINEVDFILKKNNLQKLIDYLDFSAMIKIAKDFEIPVFGIDYNNELKFDMKFFENQININSNFNRYLIYINMITMLVILFFLYFKLIFFNK